MHGTLFWNICLPLTQCVIDLFFFASFSIGRCDCPFCHHRIFSSLPTDWPPLHGSLTSDLPPPPPLSDGSGESSVGGTASLPAQHASAEHGGAATAAAASGGSDGGVRSQPSLMSMSASSTDCRLSRRCVLDRGCELGRLRKLGKLFLSGCRVLSSSCWPAELLLRC